MRHALGSKRAEYSRKNDLAIKIQLARSFLGLHQDSIKGLKLSDLEALYKDLVIQVNQAKGAEVSKKLIARGSA